MNKIAILATLATFACIGFIDCLNLPNNLFANEEPTHLVDGVDPLEQVSQAAIAPNDDEEVSQIPEKLKSRYSAFCIDSRDYVLADVKSSQEKISAAAFNFFMDSAKEIVLDVSKTTEQSMDRLGSQLSDPDAIIKDAEDDIEKYLVEGQRQIKASETYPQAVLSAFRSTFKALSSTIGTKIGEKFSAVRDNAFKLKHFITIAMGSCDKIIDYNQNIELKFTKYNWELYESAKKSGKRFNLPQTPNLVGCLTANRVAVMYQVCNMVRLAQGPIQTYMSMKEQQAMEASMREALMKQSSLSDGDQYDDEDGSVDDLDEEVDTKAKRKSNKRKSNN